MLEIILVILLAALSIYGIFLLLTYNDDDDV